MAVNAPVNSIKQVLEASLALATRLSYSQHLNRFHLHLREHGLPTTNPHPVLTIMTFVLYLRDGNRKYPTIQACFSNSICTQDSRLDGPDIDLPLPEIRARHTKNLGSIQTAATHHFVDVVRTAKAGRHFAHYQICQITLKGSYVLTLPGLVK